MHAALLVVNERARGAKDRAMVRDAVRMLGHAYRVRVVAPASCAELAEVVRTSADPLVIAGGGDGTVNAVAAALPPGATLGILPLGTANDLACELGIPATAVGAAARLVATAGNAPYASDLVVVNGRPFCTVGGVGLVTRTTADVLRMKEGSGTGRELSQLLGTLVYKLAAARAIVAGRDLVDALRVSYREPAGGWKERVVLAHALFVVNHRRCGGGLALPTASRGDDGVFELGIVHAGSRLALARNFGRLAAGSALPEDAFEVLRATEALIRSDLPLPFAADGELLARASDLVVRMRPGALLVAGVAGPS